MAKNAQVETWRGKKPTKAGFYWFSGSSPLTDDDEPTNIVLVRKVKTNLVVPDYVSRKDYALNHFNGLWLGPLKPPSISKKDMQKNAAIRLSKE